MMTKDEWLTSVFTPADPPCVPEWKQASCLVLYGAGYAGLACAECFVKHGIHPMCFVDQSTEKQGKIFWGIPVYPVLPQILRGATVIVCLLNKERAYPHLRQMLYQYGCSMVMHLFDLRCERGLLKDIPLILAPDTDRLWKLRGQLYSSFLKLADDESRSVYTSIIASLWSGRDVHCTVHPMSEQYFEDRVLSHLSDEIFVDCGAHIGETMEQFLHHYGSWQKYWVFEPDPLNLERIKLRFQTIIQGAKDKISMQCRALSNCQEHIIVKNYDMTNSIVLSTNEATGTAVTSTLDHYFSMQKITFLKIDAEGWDKKILLGGHETISKYRPVIAVAAYHRIDDFWELMDILSGYVKEYRFFLRSYMNVNETILYAVPPERLVSIP